MRTIGRIEVVGFPDWGIRHIAAKIDTGAYRCSIHCSKIEVREVASVPTLFFVLFDPGHPAFTGEELSTTEFVERVVKSSFGNSEKRYVVQTGIVFFDEPILADVSLSQRTGMRFQVLIGRKLLKGRFLVDPSKFDFTQKNRRHHEYRRPLSRFKSLFNASIGRIWRKIRS